ncbi:MAG: M48 family metalloprotease [Planctomycetes bacterium]|nr:M48 family metalloprotease [Planctomycetota bacterium]
MKRLLQATAAGALAWLIAAGCASETKHDPPLDTTAPLTPAEEFAYGRSIAARLSRAHELATDARARTYVAEVGGVVAAASGRPDPYDGWRFYIVKDAKVATWSAPGGFVFVTTGALKAAKNEDALAGILAQEMAHCALRHALEGERTTDIRPTQESWPFTPEWGKEAFQQICDRAAEKASAGWTEAQEEAASAWALAALKTAGYATEAGAVPEVRVKRFGEELAAVR